MLLLPGPGDAAVVYRYVADDGTTVLSDQPPGGIPAQRAGGNPGAKKAARRPSSRNPGKSAAKPVRRAGHTSKSVSRGNQMPLSASEVAAVFGEIRGGDEVEYGYYPVPGENAAETIARAAEAGPWDDTEDRRYPAQTRWSLGWSYEYEYTVGPGTDGSWFVSADVYSVDLRPNVRVLLPEPESTVGWSRADRSHWEEFSSGLRAHEDSHVRLVLDPRVGEGIVGDLTGDREQLQLDGEAAGGAEVHRQQVEEQRPVVPRVEADELGPRGRAHQLVKLLQVGGLSAQRGTVIDQLEGHLAVLDVDVDHRRLDGIAYVLR